MAGKGCIIPVSRKGWLLLAAAAAALALAFLLWPGREKAAVLQPPPSAARYDVTLRLNGEDNTLAISETLTFRNDTGDALGSLGLRTWLNAFETEETSPAALEELYDACYPEGFSPGYLTVYDVLWNGERAAYRYENGDRTFMTVDIPALAPDGEGTLTLRCVAKIPLCAHRTGYTQGQWRLCNVIPILSLYENGDWRREEYAPIGDPFVGACGDFTVTMYAPEGCAAACSAYLEKGRDGAWRGSVRGARDLALWIGEGYERAERTAAGVRVISFADTGAGASRALDYVCRAVETYVTLYGPAPYETLSVCRADFPFGGMEYPGLILAGRSNYLESRADTLELTLAHETAHQWFCALVGSDSYYAPWQDEALCEYAMLRYVRARYGQGSYETLIGYRVDAPMREAIPGSLTPGSPIDYFSSYADYAAVVYGRGAALLLALDELLPGGADAFLKAYAREFAFGYSARQDFEAFLNRYAGMDLSPLLLDYLDTAH